MEEEAPLSFISSQTTYPLLPCLVDELLGKDLITLSFFLGT